MATLKDLGMFGARALFGADSVDRGIQNRQTQDYNRNRNQLAELGLEFQQQQQGNKNRLADLAMQKDQMESEYQNAQFFIGALGSDFDSQPPEIQNQRWQMARQQLIGIDPSNEDMPEAFDPQGYSMVKGLASRASQGRGGYQFGAQQTFKDSEGNLFFGTTQRNPQTGEVGTILSPVGGGVAQPVGGVEMVGGYGLTGPEKVDQLREETLAKRGAEAAIDLQTKPQIAAATTKATEAAKAAVEASQGQRSNSTAYTAYTAGIKSLADALGSTTTGPVAGMLPAFSDEARIADGAIAAMAPILKQMFRSAGEGTFTDSDQKLLMDMIPTRQDGPAVQRAKFSNIDSIVRAKLGVGAESVQEPPAPQEPQVMQPQTAAPASTQPANAVKWDEM